MNLIPRLDRSFFEVLKERFHPVAPNKLSTDVFPRTQVRFSLPKKIVNHLIVVGGIGNQGLHRVEKEHLAIGPVGFDGFENNHRLLRVLHRISGDR